MGLSDADVTTPNSQSRVQCFACHRSDWFGGQISRQIGVANYGERCAIPEIDLIQLPRPIYRHPELVLALPAYGSRITNDGGMLS